MVFCFCPVSWKLALKINQRTSVAASTRRSTKPNAIPVSVMTNMIPAVRKISSSIDPAICATSMSDACVETPCRANRGEDTDGTDGETAGPMRDRLLLDAPDERVARAGRAQMRAEDERRADDASMVVRNEENGRGAGNGPGPKRMDWIAKTIFIPGRRFAVGETGSISSTKGIPDGVPVTA